MVRATILLPLVLGVLGARAWGASGAHSAPTVQASAEYRLLLVGLSDLPLDAAGAELGQSFWGEQRLRLGATLERGRLRVVYEGDLFTGLAAGDTTAVGERFVSWPRDRINAHRGFELRQAMAAVRTRYGELRVGQQVSHWGYGIVTNGGDDVLDFGDQRFGDLVERIAFVTRLWKLHVGLGADLVLRDPNAALIEGDLGLNAFGTFFFRDRRWFLGLYAAHRSQWDRDDERLEVNVLDLHVLVRGDLPARMSWEAGVEGALQVGSTTRLRPEPDLAGAGVLAGGLVTRGSLAHGPSRLRLSLEAGLASGDNDASDDTVRSMTFHPDYRVGMVLFDELLGGLTAHAADRLADATTYATMPHGTRHVPTNGGVTNAVYIWPRLVIGPFAGLTTALGLLCARAVADVIDPYSTNNLAGGLNRNYFGGPADRRNLGIELQVGIGYRVELVKGLELDLGAQWARLFVGPAFASAGNVTPPDIDRAVGRVMLRWRLR